MLHLEMMRGGNKKGEKKQRNFASTANNVRAFIPTKSTVSNYVKDGK